MMRSGALPKSVYRCTQFWQGSHSSTLPGKPFFWRTASVRATCTGGSPARLANNMSGISFMELGGIVVRGQIDLWFEHKGELIVVDYKTDRDPDVTAIAGHSLQLQIYALALEREVRRVPDRAVLFFLRESRQYEVDLSPLALGAALEACTVSGGAGVGYIPCFNRDALPPLRFCRRLVSCGAECHGCR